MSFVPSTLIEYGHPEPDDLLAVLFPAYEICLKPEGFPRAAEFGLTAKTPLLLGELSCRKLWGIRLDTAPELPGGMYHTDWRTAFTVLDSSQCFGLCRAAEMLHWQSRMQFCGKCGTKLAPGNDLACVCSGCQERFYPQIAPAVIVAVTRGDELLLAHNRRFPDTVHSLIAGFVEAGESLEQAVVREVREETGLEVGDIAYLGSQPWPFPNSLMIGFTARCVAGELAFDRTELDYGSWFSRRDALPRLPRDGSIARKIIDDFYFERGFWVK